MRAATRCCAAGSRSSTRTSDLKAHDEFQERAPKKLWTFPPGSVWLAMTDACSHAVLRGRFALEHSYFRSEGARRIPGTGAQETVDVPARFRVVGDDRCVQPRGAARPVRARALVLPI